MNSIKVYSHIPLEKEQAAKIEKIFSAKHKEKVDFEYLIDAKLLGGVLIIDNDNYYDGTLKHFLNEINKRIANSD